MMSDMSSDTIMNESDGMTTIGCRLAAQLAAGVAIGVTLVLAASAIALMVILP